MAAIVYLLCALASASCAVLLLRGYFQNGVRLLLWSALCFIGFALNNALLYVDMYILPNSDLSTMRTIPALLGIALLLYGLIWDEKE